jgi:hypothetical protein
MGFLGDIMSTTITLNTYANGDTTYVSKLNADNSTIATAVNNLLASVSTAGSSSLSLFFLGLFSYTVTVIGKSSYTYTTSGTNFVLASGYAWQPSTSAVVCTSAAVTLGFSTYAAGTYYVTLGTSGVPAISSSATDALYSVVWSGTAFTTITAMFNYFMSASDQTPNPVKCATIALAPTASGNFTVAHGLGVAPKGVTVTMTSTGSIYAQATASDATSLYLVASAASITGNAIVFY